MMDFKDGGRSKLGEHSRAKMIKQGDKTIDTQVTMEWRNPG